METYAPGLRTRRRQLLSRGAALLLAGLAGAAAGEPAFRFSTSQEPPMGTDGGVSAGVAVGDVDGDGWADLYIANWRGEPSRLYRVRPGRVIEKADGGVATAADEWASGPLLCDLDNDGRPDLFVANQRNKHNRLYWNRDGTLVAETRGDVVSDFGDSYSATCGDVDSDGLLDLVVGNSGQPLFLYRNEGDRRFVRTDALSAATADLGTRSPLFFDLNGDGAADVLAVGRSGSADAAFVSDGAGGFRAAPGFPDTEASDTEAHALGDIDNDGDVDVLVTKTNGFFADAGRRLYRNENGEYTLDADDALSRIEGPASGAAFVDIDNDGDLDAYVGHYGVRDSLFVNDGDGNFTETERPFPFTFAHFTSGHAWHDLDHDGRQDLVVSNWEGLNNFVLWNETAGGHWLQVELEGTRSNRPGIGATVWAETTVDGETLTQRRDVTAGHSFRSQVAPEAAFGLGEAPVVERLRIEWPSGAETVLTDVPAGRRVRVREDGAMTVLWQAETDEGPSLADRIGERYLSGAPEDLGELLAGDEEVALEDMRALAVRAARAGKAAHAFACLEWMLGEEPGAADTWRLQLAVARFVDDADGYARTMERLAAVVDELEGSGEQIETLENDLGYWRKFEAGKPGAGDGG